jgi:hypothetical protein
VLPATVVTAVLGVLASPGGAASQSLLGAGGLGVPVTPVDARGQALGNPGIGLSGAAILPTDPAAAADLVIPSVTFTLRHSWVDLESEEALPTASGSRFPLVGVSYPVGQLGTATLTFASALDQRWDVELERTVDLGSETARVTDSFVSDGGLSSIRLGFARRIAPSLAVGVSAGRYVGDLSRAFTRRFDSLSVESSVPAFSVGGRWRFSAPVLTGGAQLDVGDFLRVAASLTWSGSLDAEPSDDTEGRAETFDLPMEYRVGATAVLAPELRATAGLAWADWSDAGGGDLAGGGGTATLDMGVGLEWGSGSLFGRGAPLRVGWRRSEFPFRFEDETPVETAWTGGFGLRLVQASGFDLARMDLAVERGDRSAGTLSETFWRTTLSLRIAGF